MGVATTYNPGSNAARRGASSSGVPEPAPPLPMSRFNAILLLAFASLLSPAFSADGTASTTSRAPGAAAPSAQAGTGDIDPQTGLARSTVVRPLVEAAPAPGAAPVRAASPDEAVPAPGHIALILPTASPALGRLADAVRQGFTAARQAAGKDAPAVRFIPVDNEGAALLDACRQAQSAGAILVVGGITRDGAVALAHSDCARQPVLALNEPDGKDPADLSPNLFAVSLSIEQEARQVALMGVADGWHSAIVITSPSPLAQRARDAFEREWSRAAGEIRRVPYSGNPEDAPALLERLANVKADMVFLALEAPEARAVRPYIPPTLPVYATSLSVNPRAEAVVNLDLEGLRYVEMPWFVLPDHPAVMVYPQPAAPMTLDQEKLYAFGIDAFRVSLHLLRGDARRVPLDGVTGRITLDKGNVFTRTLTQAEVDGGHVIPLRTP